MKMTFMYTARGSGPLRSWGSKVLWLTQGFQRNRCGAWLQNMGILWHKGPSSPCLATRFPYGTHLNIEDLKAVEKGEQILRNYGFHNVRLRVHKNIARIEVERFG